MGKTEKNGEKNGGEGGIRTPGTRKSTQHFQCCTFGRSVTSPQKSPSFIPIRLTENNPKMENAGIAGIDTRGTSGYLIATSLA